MPAIEATEENYSDYKKGQSVHGVPSERFILSRDGSDAWLCRCREITLCDGDIDYRIQGKRAGAALEWVHMCLNSCARQRFICGTFLIVLRTIMEE